MDPQSEWETATGFYLYFQAHSAEECAMHCINDGGWKGFVVGHNTDGTVNLVCNIVSDWNEFGEYIT